MTLRRKSRIGPRSRGQSAGVWPMLMLGLMAISPSDARSQDPQLKIGDRISILVPGHPSFQGVVAVASDGTLAIPGSEGIRIPAGGRTLSSLLADLTSVIVGLVGDTSVGMALLSGEARTPATGLAADQAGQVARSPPVDTTSDSVSSNRHRIVLIAAYAAAAVVGFTLIGLGSL